MKKKTSKKIGIALAIIAATAAFLALITLLTLGEQNRGNNSDPTLSPTASDNPAETSVPIVIEDGSEKSLGYGIELKNIASVSGIYYEDGSNAMLTDFLSATFYNNSDTYIQYAAIRLNCDGVEYNFELSVVPPKSYVRAFDKNKKSAPVRVVSAKGEVMQYVAFSETPSLHEDLFEITAAENVLYIKNISGKDITEDFYICYKNYDSGILIGGICYSLKIEGGIAAGETYTAYARHFSTRYSMLMFVNYHEQD